MRHKKGFKLRNICGEHVIVAEGIENIDFSKIISLNESAAYLWEKTEGHDFTAAEMVRLLRDEYEVDEDVAKRDVDSLLEKWLVEAQIVEE